MSTNGPSRDPIPATTPTTAADDTSNAADGPTANHRRSWHNRADLPGHGLDERQQQLRDRTWVMSYQVLSTVVVAGLALVGILVLGLGRELIIDATLANAIVRCCARSAVSRARSWPMRWR